MNTIHTCIDCKTTKNIEIDELMDEYGNTIDMSICSTCAQERCDAQNAAEGRLPITHKQSILAVVGLVITLCELALFVAACFGIISWWTVIIVFTTHFTLNLVGFIRAFKILGKQA